MKIIGIVVKIPHSEDILIVRKDSCGTWLIKDEGNNWYCANFEVASYLEKHLE